MTMRKDPIVPNVRSKMSKILHSGANDGTTIRITVRRKSSLQTSSFRRAVKRSIAATRESGNPVAKYDVERRQAYLEYPDGKRTYVE